MWPESNATLAGLGPAAGLLSENRGSGELLTNRRATRLLLTHHAYHDTRGVQQYTPPSWHKNHEGFFPTPREVSMRNSLIGAAMLVAVFGATLDDVRCLRYLSPAHWGAWEQVRDQLFRPTHGRDVA
jgi:hypothetical protein